MYGGGGGGGGGGGVGLYQYACMRNTSKYIGGYYGGDIGL